MFELTRPPPPQGKITAQGKLLHRGPMVCLDSTPPANGPPKMKPYTVFLFEQILIFSEIVGKKTAFTSPVYVYKAHFMVSSVDTHARLM